MRRVQQLEQRAAPDGAAPPRQRWESSRGQVAVDVKQQQVCPLLSALLSNCQQQLGSDLNILEPMLRGGGRQTAADRSCFLGSALVC